MAAANRAPLSRPEFPCSGKPELPWDEMTNWGVQETVESCSNVVDRAPLLWPSNRAKKERVSDHWGLCCAGKEVAGTESGSPQSDTQSSRDSYEIPSGWTSAKSSKAPSCLSQRFPSSPDLSRLDDATSTGRLAEGRRLWLHEPCFFGFQVDLLHLEGTLRG